MARNPLKNSFGIGRVTQQMVLGRAAELAIINGSWLHNVSPSDLEKGRRELTGETDIAPREATLESSPESERWDPVPGSKGHKTTVPSNDDDEEDGQRSDNERFVEEGVAGAEHDQMVKAARAAASGRKQ